MVDNRRRGRGQLLVVEIIGRANESIGGRAHGSKVRLKRRPFGSNFIRLNHRNVMRRVSLAKSGVSISPSRQCFAKLDCARRL